MRPRTVNTERVLAGWERRVRQSGVIGGPNAVTGDVYPVWLSSFGLYGGSSVPCAVPDRYVSAPVRSSLAAVAAAAATDDDSFFVRDLPCVCALQCASRCVAWRLDRFRRANNLEKLS